MAEEKKVDLLNVDKKIEDGIITKVEIPTAPETKKRGRTKLSDMTEEERKKYEEEKRIKAEKKEEEKRLAELGVNVDLTNSNPYISIELSKEFLNKCKKEKINNDDYESVVFALIKKWVDGEIELKKRVKTEFY